jgi:hypothetical protein
MAYDAPDVACAEVLLLAAGVVVGDWSELLPDEVLDVAVVEEVVSEEEEFEAVVDWVDVDTVVLAGCG